LAARRDNMADCLKGPHLKAEPAPDTIALIEAKRTERAQEEVERAARAAKLKARIARMKERGTDDQSRARISTGRNGGASQKHACPAGKRERKVHDDISVAAEPIVPTVERWHRGPLPRVVRCSSAMHSSRVPATAFSTVSFLIGSSFGNPRGPRT